MSTRIIKSILYTAGTGGAGKPSTVQISEVSKNERVISTHSYRPVLGSYTLTAKSTIHKAAIT